MKTVNIMSKNIESYAPKELECELRDLACSIYLLYDSKGRFDYYNFKAIELFTGIALYVVESNIPCTLQNIVRLTKYENDADFEKWLVCTLEDDKTMLSSICRRYLNTYDNNLTQTSRLYTIKALKVPFNKLDSFTKSQFVQFINEQEKKLVEYKQLNIDNALLLA